MVGYYYKTGAEIYSILRFMKNSLNLPYVSSAGSIEVVKMNADKKYRFSFFLNVQKEIVYLIEQLGDDTTDYSKEEKPMTIYDYTDSKPDYVSNPLTALNTMIMIGNLKERFGDKLHETARKGYLTMRDAIPYKHYKLYLWYWCDSCCYGIRECTEEDFNIKEEKKMTKEEALKKIEELKEYVEKCEEKEKEIPEMPRHGNYNIHLAVPDKPRYPYISWDRSFENEKSSDLYSILSFELAQLIYAREYLKVDGEKLLGARKHGDMVFKVIFDVADSWYTVVDVFGSQVLNENDRIWCFTNLDAANKVRDYMNKYVAHAKKNMF